MPYSVFHWSESAGVKKLGLSTRPKLMAELQAAAAIGQPSLMQAYEAAFASSGVPVAQLLLTHAEVSDRVRYLNVRAALDAMIEMGAVPIINENDTVSTEELQFGDPCVLRLEDADVIRALNVLGIRPK